MNAARREKPGPTFSDFGSWREASQTCRLAEAGAFAASCVMVLAFYGETPALYGSRWNALHEVDRDTQLKQILDNLQTENNQLKDLVVRLSETIIRNVTAKR